MIGKQFLAFFPHAGNRNSLIFNPLFMHITAWRLGRRLRETPTKRNSFALWSTDGHFGMKKEWVSPTYSFWEPPGMLCSSQANTQVTPLTSIFWCLVFVHLLPLQLPPSAALSVIPFLWPSGEKNEILNFEPTLLLLKPIVFLRLSCTINSLSRAGYKHTQAHTYNSNKTNNIFFRNVHSH